MYRSISHAAIACFAIVSLFVLSPSQALAATAGQMKIQSVQQNISLKRKHWQIIASPNVGNIGSQLNAVAGVTASDIWSVGEYYNPAFSTRTLVEHWNGSTWQVVRSPNNGTDINQLNGVAAITANDVWAVGFYSNGHLRTLIEHWDGRQWSIVASPNPSTTFNSLEALIVVSGNLWAVGDYYNTQTRAYQTLVELYGA